MAPGIGLRLRKCPESGQPLKIAPRRENGCGAAGFYLGQYVVGAGPESAYGLMGIHRRLGRIVADRGEGGMGVETARLGETRAPAGKGGERLQFEAEAKRIQQRGERASFV